MIDAPNTNIKIGELTENQLEKISRAYSDSGFEISGKKLIDYSSNINEENLKFRELEITPQPFGCADDKLIFGIKSYKDGNLYINLKINQEEKIQEKFNTNLIKYFH